MTIYRDNGQLIKSFRDTYRNFPTAPHCYLSHFLSELPNNSKLHYVPVIPDNLSFLQSLPNSTNNANIDHIIDKDIFNNFIYKQGIKDLNDNQNTLCVPQRLNSIKSIIKSKSNTLKNTRVIVSWGADEDAKSVDDIYLIVRMESLRPSNNKINQPHRQDVFTICDPFRKRLETDSMNYIDMAKKIITDFDTNTLPTGKVPLTPPPE
ncbi:hypothetical protein N9L24_02585 [Candidatus Marinamargulisbacteria bacterium]|nr:hypothetical protein [Candidatus Marinamargulisbacteria bacterium]